MSELLAQALAQSIAQRPSVLEHTGAAIAGMPGVEGHGAGAQIASRLLAALAGGFVSGAGSGLKQRDMTSGMLNLARLQQANPDSASFARALMEADRPELQQLAPIVIGDMQRREQALQDKVADKQLDYALKLNYEPGLEAAKRKSSLEVELGSLGRRAELEDRARYVSAVDNPAVKAVTDARKEFASSDAYSNFANAEVAVKRMIPALRDNTGASDMPFIYGLIQSLRPGTPVRKDNVDEVIAQMSLPTQYKRRLQAAAKGTGILDQGVKQEIFKTVVDNYQVARDQYVGMKNLYTRDLKGRGIINAGGVSMLPKTKKAAEFRSLINNQTGEENDPLGLYGGR
jgi:hypothetical protein